MFSVKSKNSCAMNLSVSEERGLSYLAVIFFLMPIFFTGVMVPEVSRPTWNWIGAILLLVIVHIFGTKAGKGIKISLTVILTAAVIFVLFLLGEINEVFVWLIGVFLTVVVLARVIKTSSWKNVLVVVISVFLLQAQWAVAQFVWQQDLGMNMLGESKISVGDSGVAKFSTGKNNNDGEFLDVKIVRVYGPLNHPNSIGGVLIIGFLLVCITFLYLKRTNLMNMGDYGLYFFLNIAMPVISLGIVLTYSRSVYLAGVLGGILCSLIAALDKKRVLKITELLKKFFVVLLVIISLSPLVFYRCVDKEDMALPERQGGWTWSVKIIKENGTWRGSGIGQYKEALKNYLNKEKIDHENWQVDYAHNVFLLIAAEWGMAVFLVLMICLVVLIFTIYRRCWWWLVPLLPLLLLDHYFVTQPYPLVVLILYLLMLKARFFSMPA